MVVVAQLVVAVTAMRAAGAPGESGSRSMPPHCRHRGDCSHHGECVDGVCLCMPMYEGTRCDVWRAAAATRLERVVWENCTHGRAPPGGGGSGDSRVVQLCTMSNKSICEAAGAPTVPPPNFSQATCYQAPQMGNWTNSSGFFSSGLCQDYRGVATVVRGLKGVFCARPCALAGQLACEGCKAACQITNRSTGKCEYCSGECASEQCGNGKTYPACTAIDPCKPQSKMVCPCPTPNDAHGLPVLAKPQCILTGCGCSGDKADCGSGNRYAGRVAGPQPLCALTCDPNTSVPPGRSNCPPGASCEAAPGASFAGICTFPPNPRLPPYTPGDTSNKSASAAQQLPGYAWADYKGAPADHKCQVNQVPRFACVQNGTNASWSQTFCVNVADYAGLFPFPSSFGSDSRCWSQCSHNAPANWTPPLPGHCNHSVPPQPPPPAPPLSTNPCIRFGHTVPVDAHVDAEIVQDEDASISHTWTNYKFGDFSNWVNIFKPGKGTITLWENIAGTRGKQLLKLSGIPLTPGPLVVVVKVASSLTGEPDKYWPPSLADSIETIAASYVQGSTSSKVRLFNLSPDTEVAGMACSANGTVEIASGVRYSLGSKWYDVPTAAATFTILDDFTAKKLVSRQETPPSAPLGFTNMVIGLQKGSGAQAIQVLPLNDAPEGGVCKPATGADPRGR